MSTGRGSKLFPELEWGEGTAVPGVATGAGASPAALCHRLAMTSKGQTALEQQFKAADIRIFSITFPHTTASIGVAKEIGFVALKSNNLMYFEEQNELHRDPKKQRAECRKSSEEPVVAVL